MGIRVDGVDKLAYNHFDSYPSGLGESMVSDVRTLLKRKAGIDGFRSLARDLMLVDGKGKPTESQKKHLRPVTDLGVSSQSDDDWYCLTRDLQGDLKKTLEFGFMIDSHEFAANSLFCEYGYIVNLDDLTFEVYRGFQEKEHDAGRYAKVARDAETIERQRKNGYEYWPIALVATFPLLDIPKDWEERAFPEENDE
jgi:hypothetical protein